MTHKHVISLVIAVTLARLIPDHSSSKPYTSNNEDRILRINTIAARL